MRYKNIDINKHADKLHRNLEDVFHFSGESPELDFYISSLVEYNPFYTTDEIYQWLQDMNKEEYFQVETVPLSELRNWQFERWTGDIFHESGGFFSIRGLKIHTNIGPVNTWTQPIIDQPEIGILGIITKKINGILYFLVQAKAEPGNINTFQLSPTVQATRSNYTQVHGGKPTRYLNYFLESGRARVLVDQLQSEQGARFYRKRNRNIIVRIRDDENIEFDSNFRWLTLGQLKQLTLINNTVNMDTRSVLSNITFVPVSQVSLEPINADELHDCLANSPLLSKPISRLGIKLIVSAHRNTPGLHSMDYLLRQISEYKFNCELDTSLIPLNEVQDWRQTPNEISHVDNKFFSVIGVRVSCSNREVPSWDQPIVRQVDPGIVGFIACEINGAIHFLVQLKMESGNMDLLELAPTVQCITGSYQQEKRPPFVSEFLESTRSEVIFDTMQSEEGGRFFHEENRNMLILSSKSSLINELPYYIWMSMKQLKLFLKFNNFLNVESRSLLAIIS
jgi:oxidase EvaA